MEEAMESAERTPAGQPAGVAGYTPSVESPGSLGFGDSYQAGAPTSAVPYHAPPQQQVPTQQPASSYTQSGASNSQVPSGLLVTTTDRIDGKRITQYLGVVAGEVVLGTSISKDIKGSVRGFVGGRSSSYEKEVRYARQVATQEMVQVAQQMGATAIVGVSYSYVTVNALVMVAATGTAVRTEDI